MNLPLPVAVAIMVLVAVALLAIMWFGWRSRARRGAQLVASIPDVPAKLGAPRTEPIEALYVASTRAGDWLDPIASHELAFRSHAMVQVFDAGVMIEREGARDVFIPADAVREVSTAPGMAQLVVGKDGLVVVTWSPGGSVGTADSAESADSAGAADVTALDTGLRTKFVADRPRLIEAVRSLRAGTTSTTKEKQ